MCLSTPLLPRVTSPTRYCLCLQGKVSHYVFVSSAGAYKAGNIEPQHFVGDARKASAGHVEVENYLKEKDLPWTVFQPLYIYGPNTAKDCEQWFVDRVIRCA